MGYEIKAIPLNCPVEHLQLKNGHSKDKTGLFSLKNVYMVQHPVVPNTAFKKCVTICAFVK